MGEISRGSGVAGEMGTAFWGCEEVNEERMEAADVFLAGTDCLGGGATGRGVGLGVFPITWAAVVATGFDETVMSEAAVSD